MQITQMVLLNFDILANALKIDQAIPYLKIMREKQILST